MRTTARASPVQCPFLADGARRPRLSGLNQEEQSWASAAAAASSASSGWAPESARRRQDAFRRSAGFPPGLLLGSRSPTCGTRRVRTGCTSTHSGSQAGSKLAPITRPCTRSRRHCGTGRVFLEGLLSYARDDVTGQSWLWWPSKAECTTRFIIVRVLSTIAY